MFQQMHESTRTDHTHFLALRIYCQMSKNINNRHSILEAKLKINGKEFWRGQSDQVFKRSWT